MTTSEQYDTGAHRHTEELKEQFPEPLCYLLIELAEYNREHWLEGPGYRRRTIGAESVRETGLTANELHWAEEIAEKMDQNQFPFRDDPEREAKGVIGRLFG